MTPGFIRILQISDSHLFPQKNKTLLNVNTWDTFQAILTHVRSECELLPPHLIVLTGDIAQEATPETYQHVQETLQDFKCPIAWIPGNHDKLDIMRENLKGKPLTHEKIFQFENWEIILLNSAWTDHVEGKISSEALHRLEHQLNQHNAPNHLLMIHHPLLEVQSAWIDPLKLSNAQAMLNVIEKFPSVKVVISGHIHQVNEQVRKGITYLTTPSTSIQFKPNSEQFALDTHYPGYRYINLLPDGSFRSEVHRVTPPVWQPDLRSPGYK